MIIDILDAVSNIDALDIPVDPSELPVFGSITPNSTVVGSSTPEVVTITGTNFVPGATTARLYDDFNVSFNIAIQSITDTTIVGTLPTNFKNRVSLNLEIIASDITITSDDVFTVIYPTISSFTPGQVSKQFNVPIPFMLTGQNLGNITGLNLFGPINVKFTLGQDISIGAETTFPIFIISAENIIVTDTQITGDIPEDGLAGEWAIDLIAENGKTVLREQDLFRFMNPPDIRSVDPDEFMQDSTAGQVIRLFGSNFVEHSQVRAISKNGTEYEFTNESAKVSHQDRPDLLHQD